MSEVKKWYIGVYGGEAQARPCSPAKFEIIRDRDRRYFVTEDDFDRVTAERDTALECGAALVDQLAELQQRLAAADERADVLEGALRTSLLAMKRIYQAGYDRIIEAGGTCDTPEYMMAQDPTTRDLRALLVAKPETVAGHHPACRAVDDYKPGECSHSCKTPSGAACPGDGVGPCKKCPAVQPQPDPVLCKFYDVTDWAGLVRELVGHVAQLQDSAKRNVKPWEDTFPTTLLPAYIERVNAANAAVQPQGEPVYMVRSHGSCCWEEMRGESLEMCQAQSGEYEVRKLYAEQPAPVAVVMPERMSVPRGDLQPFERAEAIKWNACLDEVARLNAKSR